jgi:hypothetical protein
VDVGRFHVPTRDRGQNAGFTGGRGRREDPVGSCPTEVEVEVVEVACVRVVGRVGAGEGPLH